MVILGISRRVKGELIEHLIEWFGPIPAELRLPIEDVVAGDVQRVLERVVTATNWSELLAVE
jgi:hypothetical protein